MSSFQEVTVGLISIWNSIGYSLSFSHLNTHTHGENGVYSKTYVRMSAEVFSELTDTAAAFNTDQSSLGIIRATNSALKSTLFTTTCFAWRYKGAQLLCPSKLFTTNQYFERIAILHSSHVRGEHVVSQQLHSKHC